MDDELGPESIDPSELAPDVNAEPPLDNQVLQPDEPVTLTRAESGPVGAGVDGSTPLEVGIEGRGTEAASNEESERLAKDWEPYVEVDQPVQETT